MEVLVVGLEEGGQQLAEVGLLAAEHALQLGAEVGRLLRVELQQDLAHLRGVLANHSLQVGIGGDGLPLRVDPLLDLVEPARRLELELILVDLLGEQEPALAGRDHFPLDDLHPVEGLLERLVVGADVVEKQQIGVGRLAGDPVLEKLQAVEGILVEVLPELVGGRARDRLGVRRIDRLLVEHRLGVLEIALQHRDDLADVPLLGSDLGLRPRLVGVGLGVALGLDGVPQLLEREIDGVARGDQRAADPHRDDRLDVRHLQQRGPHLGEVVELREVWIAHHHPPHHLQRILGLGVVDLDVAGDAADHAAAHRGHQAVEQRVAGHHQQAAEEDDSADDDGLEAAGEQIPKGHLRDHPQGGEPAAHTCAPCGWEAATPGVTRSTNLPSASRTMELALAITC